MEKFTLEVKKCIQKAIEMYKLPIGVDDIKISYYPKGQAAGWAGYETVNDVKVYFLRFCTYNIENNYEEMVKNTVPHEVAHIACYINPDLGKGHDIGWKVVCYNLGGNAQRTHKMDILKARKSRYYVYNLDGKIFNLSSVRHKRIQEKTKIYHCNRTKKAFTPEHFTGETFLK